MSKFHNSHDAERLALAWHRFGVVVSGLSLLVAIGGLGWHLWACREHEERLEELDQECPT